MCTDGTRPGGDGASGGGHRPGTAAEALAMMDAALDFLNGDFLAGAGGSGLDSRRAGGG